MKKQIIFIILFLVGVINLAKAQDTLIFKNQESKIVKISQIKSEEITCKDISNIDGPDYVFELKKIKEIHFSNGAIQSYDTNEDSGNLNGIEQNKYKEATTKELTSPENLNFKNYKEKSQYYKNIYYQKMPGDPYNQWVAGVASYFVPGLGQMICGETGRGLAFLGGSLGATALTFLGYVGFISTSLSGFDVNDNGTFDFNGNSALFLGLTTIGAISTVGINIWSIVDAVNVARVNNLYKRDMANINQIKIQLSPYIDTNKSALTLSKQPTLGLSLNINF